MMGKDILVVDDEMGIRELLSEILMDEGYDVTLADSATQAREVRNRMHPDLVLLDIWMPDLDGIALLKEWKTSGQLTMPVVMMSGHGTIDTAVEAIRIGAAGFLEKPIALKKLLEGVVHGLQHVPLVAMPSLVVSEQDRVDVPIIEHTVTEKIPRQVAVAIDLPLREARDLFERRYFEMLIKQTHGNMSRAAELAGVERTHLYRKLKQLGVEIGRKVEQDE